jgi:hypothetical protein
MVNTKTSTEKDSAGHHFNGETRITDKNNIEKDVSGKKEAHERDDHSPFVSELPGRVLECFSGRPE